MNWLESILLGIIQGLTEFLPVSSSGHIELGKAILGVQPQDPLLFSIVLHGATALSTIVVFHKEITWIFKDLFQFKWNEGTKYAFYIVLSMIPVGLVGALFESELESFFDGKVVLVGAMLWLTALLLFFSGIHKGGEKPVNGLRAGIMGLSQMVAILPGISRSGSTIATALLLGVKKEDAARFSFLMVLPPILGATLLKVKDFAEEADAATGGADISTSALVLGFLAAFIAGLAACKWMVGIVKKGKLWYFAIYCALVGTIAFFSDSISQLF